MCIPKIHLSWHLLTLCLLLHLFPLRKIALEAAEVAKQLANRPKKTTTKRQQLRRRITAKPFDQSASSSESSLDTLRSITKQKESSRFCLDRAVDAHFRFRAVGDADAKPLKTAAPNSVCISPRTPPTSWKKLSSIVEVLRALRSAEHRSLFSFCNQSNKTSTARKTRTARSIEPKFRERPRGL